MKEKVIKFTRDADKISDLAYSRRDREDYVGALSVLHYESLKAKDPEIIAQIADVYTQMNMFESAITYWYKYLKYSPESNYCEAYNALGANYYFINNDNLAGFYFNEQIKTGVTDEMVFSSVLEDYFNELHQQRLDTYRVAYPPKQIDLDEDNLFDGKDLMLENEFKKAIEKFELIKKTSELYLESLVEKAYAEFELGDSETALVDVDAAIKGKEINVRSLNLGIKICLSLGKTDKLAEYIELLNSYEGDDEENYKKLNFLCDLSLYDDALSWVKRGNFELCNMANVNYISAILHYNKGQIDKAVKLMRNAYIISQNPISKYYLAYFEEVISGKRKYESLDLSFGLPEKENERRLLLIKKLFSAKGKLESKVGVEEFEEIAEWALKSTGERYVQLATAVVIISYKLKKLMHLIDDALIDPAISDEVKYRIVSFLCESGFSGKYCVVYSGIFKKIQIKTPKIDGEYAELFIKAFAYAFGRLSVVNNDYKKLIASAEDLSDKASERGIVLSADDVIPLGCAIYIYSGIEGFIKPEFVYKFFDANPQSVNRILKELVGEKND